MTHEIPFSLDDKRRLEHLARALGVSVVGLIRRAVRERLDRDVPTQLEFPFQAELDRLYAQAVFAATRYRSAVRKLAPVPPPLVARQPDRVM